MRLQSYNKSHLASYIIIHISNYYGSYLPFSFLFLPPKSNPSFSKVGLSLQSFFLNLVTISFIYPLFMGSKRAMHLLHLHFRILRHCDLIGASIFLIIYHNYFDIVNILLQVFINLIWFLEHLSLSF